MSKQISRAKRGGFTFTEVLIASAILAACIIPILNALARSHQISVSLERKSRCLIAAQSCIEELNARAETDYDSSWIAINVPAGDGFYSSIYDTPLGSSLRRVKAVCGYDLNGDSRLDDDEILAELTTLISRRR